MGALQTAFDKLLHGDVVRPLRTVSIVRRDDLMRSQYLRHISHVYETLGGGLKIFEFRMPRWDLEYNGVAIELDEALHFNRYRIETLRSSLYKRLPAFPVKLYRKSAATTKTPACALRVTAGNGRTSPAPASSVAVHDPVT